ncbi:signal peptidase I [Lacticaseibacillus absianus]|uniref:signal peptidase I n=1 Tax=Lacticaseibacillus absianus TaxID=2729623 RepID=UPI0015C96BB7|nr:signal peptidase I [Lacticaseibacillus absianus]
MTGRKQWQQLRQLLALMGTVVLVIGVIFGVRVVLGLFLENNSISGNSMAPTLEPGERIVSRRDQPVHRNDIVILDSPDGTDHLYIKRVIGMPGDTVAVRNEQLYLNGRKTAQPYLKRAFMADAVRLWARRNKRTAEGGQFTDDFDLTTLKATATLRVPKGEYFVMGDNRRVSYDSRNFGFVKASAIQATVVWRYWPLDQMKTF